MDIEELGMILSKNYDAIRDKNIEMCIRDRRTQYGRIRLLFFIHKGTS